MGRASHLDVGEVVVYCLLVDRFGVASARSEWCFRLFGGGGGGEEVVVEERCSVDGWGDESSGEREESAVQSRCLVCGSGKI